MNGCAESDRANRLIIYYNRRFNPIVHRDYSTVGVRLTLPGMAEDWRLDAHPPFGGCWPPLPKTVVLVGVLDAVS